jgi:hypothetical protein
VLLDEYLWNVWLKISSISLESCSGTWCIEEEDAEEVVTGSDLVVQRFMVMVEN